jgi:hypothetical protein
LIVTGAADADETASAAPRRAVVSFLEKICIGSRILSPHS